MGFDTAEPGNMPSIFAVLKLGPLLFLRTFDRSKIITIAYSSRLKQMFLNFTV